MPGSQTGPAAFREPPSGGPRKAQLEVSPQSRSLQQSMGSERRNLTFSLKVTCVRHAPSSDHANGGISSAGSCTLVRGCPGTREIKPFAVSVTTIW